MNRQIQASGIEYKPQRGDSDLVLMRAMLV